MGETEDERTTQACQLFENFVQASTCKGTLQAFSILCRQLELDPLDHSNFYNSLKAAISTWKVKALWVKLDKRAQLKVYNQNKACQGTRVRKTMKWVILEFEICEQNHTGDYSTEINDFSFPSLWYLRYCFNVMLVVDPQCLKYNANKKVFSYSCAVVYDFLRHLYGNCNWKSL